MRKLTKFLDNIKKCIHFKRFTRIMGKKFVPIQRRNHKYKLFLADIRSVHKCPVKKTPLLPPFDKNDVSTELPTDNELSFEPMILSEM